MISNIIIIKKRNIHELQLQTFIKKTYFAGALCCISLCSYNIWLHDHINMIIFLVEFAPLTQPLLHIYSINVTTAEDFVRRLHSHARASASLRSDTIV